jgi:ribosomal protein S18 acetylase RimI-like enzyme
VKSTEAISILSSRTAPKSTTGRFVVIEHPRAAGLPHVRSVELRDGSERIAVATWTSSQNADGVVKLLHVEVSEDKRRKGHGSAVFEEAIQLAREELQKAGFKLRRVIAETEQKKQIVARSWLTHLGFHHVTTVKNTLVDQDLLVYLLGCD